jgi:hypothetical protein
MVLFKVCKNLSFKLSLQRFYLRPPVSTGPQPPLYRLRVRRVRLRLRVAIPSQYIFSKKDL